MYIPDDVWNYIIKKFLFKTKEMKEYDKFVINFKNKIKKINFIKKRNNVLEDYLFIQWDLKKQICFIDNYLW